jgi:hypothetical protein
VADVHAQRDLGLLPVSAERALPYQDADNHAAVEIVQGLGHAMIVSPSCKT